MGLISPNLFQLVSLKNEPRQVSGLNCNIVLAARDKSSEVSGRGITEGEMEAPSPQVAPKMHHHVIST